MNLKNFQFSKKPIRLLHKPPHISPGIEESKNVKHSYVDLEEEVKVRKNELDILSEEKTRSELSARKYRALLDTTKAALNGLVGQITGGLEEGAEKRTEEKTGSG